MSGFLSRRNFLFHGGAIAAGVTFGQLARRHFLAAAADAAARASTEERWAVSVCRECPAACGVRVRLIDDLPVKLEGNPLCPIGRGRLCAKGQASVEAYYDPDRLTGPAKRVGPHGSGQWQKISWEEATALLVSRLKNPAGGPGQLLAVGAEEAGPVGDAWSQVWRAAGGRVHTTPMATATRLRERFQAMTGVPADPYFDYEHATHVLSFGAPLVEDWLSPIWSQRTFGRFRRSNGRPRGRLVQVEGRRSLTARKSDEWIAVPADRQAFLAYGLAAALLRENRVDPLALDPFLKKLGDFKDVVTARFTPDEVAAATGVPVVTVLRLARELVSAERPLVVVSAEATRETVDAVFALNALLGAFDRPGGIYAASPPVYAAPPQDAMANAGAPPRVIVFRDSAQFRSLDAAPDLERALSTAELVVSFSPFLDEAASVADLVLPTHTSLESWHAVVPATCLQGQSMAVAKPAAAALFDTRDVIGVLKAVADAVGGPMAAACPWASSEELVGEHLTRLAALRHGGPYTSAYETEWMRQLERGGWWTAAADSPEAIAQAIAQAGGWVDPFFETGQIRRRATELEGCAFPAPPPLATAPLASVRLDEVHPLQLETFIPSTVSRVGSANLPVLFELLGQPEARPWGPWVELSSDTARMVGVASGDRVRVESASGAVEASVVVVDGMLSGTVALAFVPAVPTGGRWAREIALDVRNLAAEDALRSGRVPVRILRA